MAKLEIVNKATRGLNKVKWTFKKYSPEILIVGGVIGTVATTVMACKATTKLGGILEEGREKEAKLIELVEENKDVLNKETESGEIVNEYTEEDLKKDIAVTKIQTGLKVVRLYAPAVGVGVMSIAAILGGYKIIHKRNVALTAAYNVVNQGFKDYRKRVVDRFGEELDKELRYGLQAKEVEEKVVNEDGSETTVKKTVTTCDSPYSYLYTVGNTGWQKDANKNKVFLIQLQNWWNDKLKAEGVVTLNQVLASLGFHQTQEGLVVGWVYDKNNEKGDNFIDFGMFEATENCDRFNEGYEPSIWLDFNVDGNIYELMGKYKRYAGLR